MPVPPPPPLPSRRRRLAGFNVGASVVVVLIVTGFYLEENWRGARDWAVCQRELGAKGEMLDWQKFVPPPVPDDQNLAMAQAVDPKAHRLLPDKLDAGVRARAAWFPWYTNLQARLTVPLFDDMPRRFARLQTGVDEAVTACALERFFLDHQTYPGRLDELVPAYLIRVPNDVIDGAPLRYHATPDGRYRLYGVGWDRRDYGGQVVWNEHQSPDIKKGDWVWQYTELKPPTPRK